MTDTSDAGRAHCQVCGKAVYRMFGSVALVRARNGEFEARAVCLAYCREHRGDVRVALVRELRHLGTVVAHTRPALVRPSRRREWAAQALRHARREWRAVLGDEIRLFTPDLTSYPEDPHRPQARRKHPTPPAGDKH